MDWVVQLAVGLTVTDQLSLALFPARLQLLKNAPIAWTGKEERAPGILAEVGVVMERRELIVDCHAPDAGADIMRGVVNAA